MFKLILTMLIVMLFSCGETNNTSKKDGDVVSCVEEIEILKGSINTRGGNLVTNNNLEEFLIVFEDEIFMREEESIKQGIYGYAALNEYELDKTQQVITAEYFDFSMRGNLYRGGGDLTLSKEVTPYVFNGCTSAKWQINGEYSGEFIINAVKITSTCCSNEIDKTGWTEEHKSGIVTINSIDITEWFIENLISGKGIY